MRFGNITGSADHGGYTHLLEQARLGAVGHFSHRRIARELHGPAHDGVGFRCGETHRLAGPDQIDARLWIDLLHLARELCGVGSDLLVERVRRRLRQGAHVEVEFTVLGYHVGGNAAANQPRRQGRVGYRETIVALLYLREAIGDLTNVDDQSRCVFDGVDAMGDVTRMRLASVHRTAESMGALVGNDGLHGGRFTDDATARPDAVFLQVPNQAAYTQAADLFVVTQGIVQWCIEPLTVKGGRKLRRLGED